MCFYGCQSEMQSPDPEQETVLDLPSRPNILWLVTEDLGPYLPMFGDSTIQTPNLSRLAAEGVVYPNLYSPSGVCAPSRAAIATGMYPSSIGANHMRTSSYTEVTGNPVYEAVPPPRVRMMSELLRINGYYCTNNSKKDYQFKDPVTAWDESSNFAHWRNRSPNQPFFSIFNFTTTHESGLFEPYGFRKNEFRHYHAGDTSFTSGGGGRTLEEETAVHVPKDTDFPIPPYLPDTELVRRDMWKMYNNIAEMDQQLGAVLEQLEADGLLENTIIFFYADHGGPLHRQKRLIYDSGLNSPMIIRFPNKQLAGSRDEQLISFIDFAPTVYSLAGIAPPEHLQGQAFLGDYQAPTRRDFIHAAADRFDGFTDAIRAVRDQHFKYIRNYRPDQGYYLPVVYREQIPTTQELLRLKEEGGLDAYPAHWFRESKDPEELFDCENDPHELHNLATDPAYKNKLTELSTEMDRWLSDIGDQPNLPERALIGQLWQGNNQQPVTDDPVIEASDAMISIHCDTDGASIGFKIVNKQDAEPGSWQVYTAPFQLTSGSRLMVQAHRIGYKPSEVIRYPQND
jgi:arylsulfatase A-like enzyme